jgi:hypothetical protein
LYNQTNRLNAYLGQFWMWMARDLPDQHRPTLRADFQASGYKVYSTRTRLCMSSQVSGTRRRDSFGCGMHGFTETNIDQPLCAQISPLHCRLITRYRTESPLYHDHLILGRQGTIWK